MSAYVAPERVKAARELDLFSYLQSREPNELVRDGPNAYRLRSHDSLKISNGKWCWWSRGVGGRSALDFLITVRGMDLPHAVEMIEGVHSLLPILPSKPPPQEPKLLKLPPPYRNNQLAVRYLMGRGIQREVMKYCLEHRLVYEEARYHNAVFVGYDETGKPRSACIRGTGPKRFFKDAIGSDKRYSFSVPARSATSTLHLFEGSIDALSYASLLLLKGEDWQAQTLLSQDGVAPPRKDGAIAVPMALQHYLDTHPEAQTIVLHYDNDGPGRAAAQALREQLKQKYNVLDEPPPAGKDVNDTLRQVLHERCCQEQER